VRLECSKAERGFGVPFSGGISKTFRVEGEDVDKSGSDIQF
jgi:hypothetical protein